VNEQSAAPAPDPAPSAPVERTKHSTTIRARDGSTVTLTRGDTLHALVIARHGQVQTSWLNDADLHALLIDPTQCCANCAHMRRPQNAARCYERIHAKAGSMYAPRIEDPKTHVCGKFKPLIAAPAREVAA
jgi:hypothetical protein